MNEPKFSGTVRFTDEDGNVVLEEDLDTYLEPLLREVDTVTVKRKVDFNVVDEAVQLILAQTEFTDADVVSIKLTAGAAVEIEHLSTTLLNGGDDE